MLEYNVNRYEREKLYKEVWENPVVDVAVQYGVSDVAIHKVCKALNIPVPPRGYWAKLRAGQTPDKTPLPATKGDTVKIGAKLASKPTDDNKKTIVSTQPLGFLSETEKQRVITATQQIGVLDENEKLHEKIIAHKAVIKEWDKKRSQQSYQNNRNQGSPPFLATGVSNEMLPRIFRILSAIYKEVETLGGSVNDDLSLQIRGERVFIEIAEGQDKVEHVLTKQEAMSLLEYEDAKRHRHWASEPQIRKYDNVYNGRLRFCIRQYRYYRDTEKTNVESRLGDILIDLYEESEVLRLARIAREEEHRKREEEARQREERRIRYNTEIKRTKALENLAQDYDMTCKIRAYIAAVESQNVIDEQTKEWIDWANKKADWYDPTIARDDKILGKREHSKDTIAKELKERYSSWY